MGIRGILVGAGALGALLLAPRVAAAPKVADQAADEAAIAGILEDETAGWNRGDAEAFAAHAAPDVVFTNIVGMFSVGKTPFVGQHHAIFTTIYAGSTVRFVVENIAFSGSDTALVSTLARLSGFKELPPGAEAIDGAVYTRLLQVMARTSDGWRITAFHNVIIQPRLVDDKVLALTAG